MMFVWGLPVPPKPEKPKPKPEVEESEEDKEFGERLQAFSDLGFDHLEALTLAWEKVSPSDVRERFIKKGWTPEQVCRVVL